MKDQLASIIHLNENVTEILPFTELFLSNNLKPSL